MIVELKIQNCCSQKPHKCDGLEELAFTHCRSEIGFGGLILRCHRDALLPEAHRVGILVSPSLQMLPLCFGPWSSFHLQSQQRGILRSAAEDAERFWLCQATEPQVPGLGGCGWLCGEHQSNKLFLNILQFCFIFKPMICLE